MEHLKKIFASGALALLVGFVTNWTQLLHTESLVHPDWEKSVDADARAWSVAALIILYIALYSLTRRVSGADRDCLGHRLVPSNGGLLVFFQYSARDSDR